MDKKMLKQISIILEDLRQEIDLLTINKNSNTTNHIKEEIENLNFTIDMAYQDSYRG